MGTQETTQFLSERKKAYQLTFRLDQPNDVFVLDDLAAFCRANEPCAFMDKDGKYDPLMSAVLQGRREVWLRIQQHLGLTPEQLFSLYSGNTPQLRTTK